MKKTKIALDKDSARKRRGRRARVLASEVAGRGKHYRIIFGQVWKRLWPLLSQAQTEEQVREAFKEGAVPYDRQFMPSLAALVLRVVREPKFPRRQSKAQANFLADSLAGLGRITPRRSRDIFELERSKEKQAHHIIQYEFYVVCSCGYKGHSRHHACPKCGARIEFWPLERLAPPS
jgi:hypothetical protein